MCTIDRRVCVCVHACKCMYTDTPLTHCREHRCERGNGGKGQTSWIEYK